MARHAFHFSIIASLLAALGCGQQDDTGKLGADARQTGKDAVAAARDAGRTVGDELGQAADALDDFARSVAGQVSEKGEALAQDVSAKMPDVENLVDRTKDKLVASGADGQALASRLDEKLATLRSKVDTLARSAAAGTVQMKDDVVAAFKELLAEIRSDLARLG